MSEIKLYIFVFLLSNSTLHEIYIFNEIEKKESGGYDVVVVYWRKKPINEIVGIIKRFKTEEAKKQKWRIFNNVENRKKQTKKYE